MSEKKGLLPIPDQEAIKLALLETGDSTEAYMDKQMTRLMKVNPWVGKNLAVLCENFESQGDELSANVVKYVGVSTYRILELQAEREGKELPKVGFEINNVIKRSSRSKGKYVSSIMNRLEEDNPPIYKRLQSIIDDLMPYGDSSAAACSSGVLVCWLL